MSEERGGEKKRREEIRKAGIGDVWEEERGEERRGEESKEGRRGERGGEEGRRGGEEMSSQHGSGSGPTVLASGWSDL